MIKLKSHLASYIQSLTLSVLVGLIAGLTVTLFLLLLERATQLRMTYPTLIIGLPIAGFCIGWIYHHFGKNIVSGNVLILEEIHNPKKIVPALMAPFILIGTLLTHLCGGSAGREGTAVQISASLSDQLTRLFKTTPEQRKRLLMASIGTGFGTAIGTPLAGIIFGIEVIQKGKRRFIAALECAVASFTGFYIATYLHAPHSHFNIPQLPNLTFQLFFYIAISGIIFGLTCKFFIKTTHTIQTLVSRYIPYPPLIPFLGGILLIILFYLEGSYRYTGLGIQNIQEALQTPSTFTEPLFKLLFTALTLGTGFKGGEFIPLVYIGTTLGSALSLILPVPVYLLASVGFASIFGAASKTPIACTIMACELFGFSIAPFALLACLISNWVSGQSGIYKSTTT